MKSLIQKPRATALLGLSFHRGRLEGVVVRRTNGSVEVGQPFSVALTLDPLTHEPELVGREIRNHLEAAEIRERRCAVCLPDEWLLTLQTVLPELADEDIASYLQIEAERGFPYGPDALVTTYSRFRGTTGPSHATQVAVPRDHIQRLEQVLRAARLTPVTFSPGLVALQPGGDPSTDGTVALGASDEGVGLLIRAGGIAALRAIKVPAEAEGGDHGSYIDSVARELRITLGQLTPEVRERLRRIRIFGSGPAADRLTEEVRTRAPALGLSVERVEHYAPGELGLGVPAEAGVSPQLSLAARHLAGWPAELEFLPPRLSTWQQLTARYSSKGVVYGGVVAGAVLLLVAGAFLIQEVRLIHWRSQWAAMSGKVHELESLQQQIRQFRPWFDDSLRNLSILRRLTEAFPEDGNVSAKTVEIREPAIVTCSGTARDSAALRRVTDQLYASKDVSDVHVETRGTTPLQFTVNFHWGVTATVRQP
jgi:hypothetical protein